MSRFNFFTLLAAVALVAPMAAAQKALSAEAKGECASLAATMQAGSCGALQAATKAHTAEIIGMDCPALFVFRDTMPVAPADCCPMLRTFITTGCACDPDVTELLALGGGTEENMVAALKMAQVGSCAEPQFGGPILNPCTNDVGCAAVLPP